MVFDMTARVKEAWEFFDRKLDRNLQEIAERAEVPRECLIKINPAEFVEKNKHQYIRGYKYQKMRDFITENKTSDHIYLVSPEDAIEETAAQISYKSGTEIRRTIRASKCEVLPVPTILALDFFIRNHRQTNPPTRGTAVCFGLVYKDELVAVMMYDIMNGGIRGAKTDYELSRLSISKGTKIHGGASKLQMACENTLREMGVHRIFSYSNATINSGAVYEKLGFKGSRVQTGQPFVIKKDNSIVRLINVRPYAGDEELALRGHLKVHLGGNKTWVKEI